MIVIILAMQIIYAQNELSYNLDQWITTTGDADWYVALGEIEPSIEDFYDFAVTDANADYDITVGNQDDTFTIVGTARGPNGLTYTASESGVQ